MATNISNGYFFQHSFIENYVNKKTVNIQIFFNPKLCVWIFLTYEESQSQKS